MTVTPLFFAALLFVAVWMVFTWREEILQHSYKKRTNGFDVNRLKVLFENLPIEMANVSPKELAIVKSFMADEVNTLTRFESVTYKDTEGGI